MDNGTEMGFWMPHWKLECTEEGGAGVPRANTVMASEREAAEPVSGGPAAPLGRQAERQDCFGGGGALKGHL